MRNNRIGRRVFAGRFAIATLLASTFLTGFAVAPSRAQEAAQRNFSIPAGPLSRALAAFGNQSGLQVTYVPDIAVGKSSSGVSGALTPQAALARLLQGSGLSYSFPAAGTVAIIDPAQSAGTAGAVEGDAIQLDTIDVSASRDEGMTAETPYETAAPVAHISGETIERFRGSSPADMLRGTPGVMSGEARNSGALDVNIRGMQGMGRVATTVDGAENAVSIYHGYQGASQRTFVDPDFIAGIDIQKGSDLASRGIAGSVAMRTLSASDIVKEGDTWGVRVKGGVGNNTSKPQPGNTGGYAWPPVYWYPDVATPSPNGMDRPSFLEPTNGSVSAIAAVKQENYDFLFGYAYRRQGNYHAGEHGPSAKPVSTGPRTICNSYGYCEDWPNYIENAGISNYRAGEEVLNTELETESFLAKATLHFSDEQSLQIGYTGYRGETGDRMASQFATERTQPIQQATTAGAKLDSGTLRYRWDPSDNDLINLKANLWLTDLELRNQPRNAYGTQPPTLGLPAGYRTGADTFMWGTDITNTSKFSFDGYGTLDLTYGASWLTEDTRPRAFADIIEGWLNLRDAERNEVGTFVKAAYKPFDWLTLNGGLRYAHYDIEDRRTWANSDSQLNSEPNRSEGGFSPSVGVTVEPLDGVQIYTNYSNALRFPSLIETVSAFTLIVNSDLEPERASNWEAGVNLRKDGLFGGGDRGMLKLGYFNWDIDNYISRQWSSFQSPSGSTYWGMGIINIDRAKFSGLELSGRYENDGFTAELGANYYLNVEYCLTSDTCDNTSLYSDYATNHVPPEYSFNLTLSQKLFDDRLTVGGRVTHTGPRAIGHGQETAAGLSSFIELINWKPYTLVDLFAEYRINDNLTASVSIENLTDRYYVDPLGLVNQPGPGRTMRVAMTGTLGGDHDFQAYSPVLRRPERGEQDWTGLYAGVHAGAGLGRIEGNVTALDGTADPVAATESPDLALRNSFFSGAQAGFNWQFDNRLVLGLEADYTSTSFGVSQEARATETSLAGRNVLQAATVYDLDWLSTVRGRLGYALDNGLLLYGTGGVAFARETATRSQFRSTSASSGAPNGTATAFAFDEKAEETRAGWTLGAGAEYAITRNWSVKGEYSYTHFPDQDFEFPNATAGTGLPYTSGGVTYPGSFATVNGRRASNALDLQTVKIGLNYRF